MSPMLTAPHVLGSEWPFAAGALLAGLAVLRPAGESSGQGRLILLAHS